MFDGEIFLAALGFQAGYNTSVVMIGAILLGWAGGTVGSFLLLRQRSLVSDAISHATLPGIGVAFLVMAYFGGSGRYLPGLLIGATISSAIGLWFVERITSHTRLTSDAAIGAILSSFFGLGIVLLTIIQSVGIGEQSGIGSFLLGSASGMLQSEAFTLAFLAGIVVLCVFFYRNKLTLVAFDEVFAETSGINIRKTDLILLALVLAVTVVGLRIVGLILVVALMIIPPVAARFWSDKVTNVTLLSGCFGAASGMIGTALSAAVPNLPTGAIIVLVAAVIFTFSLLFAPVRGVFYSVYRAKGFSRKVHLRQGLLALLRHEEIYDKETLSILNANGYVRADGKATNLGLEAADNAAREEALWGIYFRENPDAASRSSGMRLDPIETRLTSLEVQALETQLLKNSGGYV